MLHFLSLQDTASLARRAALTTRRSMQSSSTGEAYRFVQASPFAHSIRRRASAALDPSADSIIPTCEGSGSWKLCMYAW